MRVIVIEAMAYMVSEADFQTLTVKKELLDSEPYRSGKDMEMLALIDELKPKFYQLGYVDFDFRL